MQKKTAAAWFARAQTQVVCGPWAHDTIGNRDCHGVDFGPAAALDTTDLKLRWFDHWLKGVDNGRGPRAAGALFRHGRGAVAETPRPGPPTGLTQRTWRSGQRRQTPNGAQGDGRLDPKPGGTERKRTAIAYDPQDPVPTLWSIKLTAGGFGPAERGAPAGHPHLPHGRLLRRTWRSWGLRKWSSTPPPRPPIRTGFARLVDDEPDGRAVEVCYGMVRARHRHSWDSEAFITPQRGGGIPHPSRRHGVPVPKGPLHPHRDHQQ